MGGGDFTAAATASGSRTDQADLIAVAVIAAARVYGEDPIAAVSSAVARSRQCLAPAVHGLVCATRRHAVIYHRPLGVTSWSYSTRASRGAGLFRRAADAAERAVVERLAGWTGEPVSVPPRADPAILVAPPAPPPPPPSPSPPPPPPDTRPQRTITAKAARAAVREILQTDNATAPDIAEALNLGEAAVRGALRDLAELGEARPDAVTNEGWRKQYWRLVPRHG